MDGSHGQIARSEREGEQLSKEWLLRMIARTPLPEVDELPVSWIVAEAPSLVSGILEALAEPGEAAERELTPEDRRRAEMLTRLREGPDAPEQIPRDLAALQALLVETLRRDVPEREPGDFARAVARLADVFGSIQGAVTRSLVEERAGGAAADSLTGLPGPVQLDEWLRLLLAEQRRYGHTFSLALVDVEGLARINDAYGNPAGDRIVVAIAGVIRRQLREVDQAFRLEQDEFAILAPHTDADGLIPIALRMSELISSSQLSDGPRIAIAAGVVECPRDGLSADQLLESAAEASYAAKASGVPVGRSGNGPRAVLQDP